MSEESKTSEGDYVIMGSDGLDSRSTGKPNLSIDDPNLTQEEKDHRLAIALQQQENAAAYNEHKKKHDEHVKAHENRTARSATYTKLAAVRQKDHGMLAVPSEYTADCAYTKSDKDGYVAPNGGIAPPPANASPQEIADYQLAVELQKVEQVDAGTVRTMQKMVHEEEEEEEAHKLRTTRSKNTL
jgi:hypothetical protein